MTETGCCIAASENEACGKHEKWSSNKVNLQPLPRDSLPYYIHTTPDFTTEWYSWISQIKKWETTWQLPSSCPLPVESHTLSSITAKQLTKPCWIFLSYTHADSLCGQHLSYFVYRSHLSIWTVWHVAKAHEQQRLVTFIKKCFKGF